MGIFESMVERVKHAARDAIDRSKERAAEEQRKQREREEWLAREPEFSTVTLDAVVEFPHYDFSGIPCATNDTQWTRPGTIYLSGQNYETVMNAFRLVGESISTVKSRNDVRCGIAQSLLLFQPFSQGAVKRKAVLTMDMCNDYDSDYFYLEDEDEKRDLLSEIPDDEEVIEVSGNLELGNFNEIDVNAFLDKEGNLIYATVTYEYNDAKGEPKYCECDIERKIRGTGYKAKLVIS